MKENSNIIPFPMFPMQNFDMQKVIRSILKKDCALQLMISNGSIPSIQQPECQINLFSKQWEEQEEGSIFGQFIVDMRHGKSVIIPVDHGLKNVIFWFVTLDICYRNDVTEDNFHKCVDSIIQALNGARHELKGENGWIEYHTLKHVHSEYHDLKNWNHSVRLLFDTNFNSSW